jgi:hypothetical protein
MSKPNWACSGCGMYSSRRWSVERHILNLHDGIGNAVPFVDYLVGRKSGFYLPKFRPILVKKNATKTVTVMDTFKDELLKVFASKAVNKALSSSPIQNHQFSNFQGFGGNGAPYFYPNQFPHEPLHIPRPEDIFGFEIYVCKKCSSLEPIIISFNDGQEGGSKMSWATCCGGSTDLKKLDQKNLNDNNMRQRIHDKLKYFVKTWANNKPMLTAIRIPEGFHGNSVRLLQGGNQRSISLEYPSEKIIKLEIDDENYWAPRCVRTGTMVLSHDDLSDFLGKTENATFGCFRVKIKEFKGIFLMAILNDFVYRKLRLG